tara:strand:- start:941 stop:1240 length:300 start_codon:yes stop_codon:yes gene_type:complete
MPNPTVGAIKELSDMVAGKLRFELVTGFASAGGNGSSAISGLSPASDAPLSCMVFGDTAAGSQNMTLASVTFVVGSSRMQIANTDTSAKSVMLVWWDRS